MWESLCLHFFIITFVLFCDSCHSQNNISRQLPPPENEIYAREQVYIAPFKKSHDEALTCGQLIVSRGFKYERHFVTTEDGYILQLYRIINPYAQAARGSKLIPVLLVHGIFTSCSSWMFNGFDGFIEPWVDGKPPNVTSNSLAFVLANGEFDVWIANNRGTAYSRNHTHLNPNTDSKFWDYSFADMGKYDVPAMVNHVIDKTKYDKIVYVGFSRGTEQIFIQLAENPSFADKLYLNINLAPIAFRGNPKGISGLVPSSRSAFLAQASYVGPVPPFLAEFDAGLTLFCSIPILKQICIEVYSKYFGPDRPMIDEEIFQVLTSHIDATSNKDNLHTRQAVYYDQIRKFDYGNRMNLKLYGSEEPPKYPFENIPTYNLVLISGQNDYLATQENVQKLRNILNGTALVDYMIPYSKWSHTDFIFGNQAYKYSHSVILRIMRDYFSRQSG